MSLSPEPGKSVRGHAGLSLIAPWLERAHLLELGLTPRECDVMEWISEGKRDREIAIILGLSRRTVEKHAAHIYDKLHVETRTAAVRSCQCSYHEKKPALRVAEVTVPGRNKGVIHSKYQRPARGDPT